MNRRRTESGVALITTLIMLSLVTFMAVAFLSLTRRERGSVKTAEQQTTARTAEETARVRAQWEVLARMIASRNRHNYDLLVSTNYIKATGFTTGDGTLANVNYDYMTALPLLSPLSMADQIQNIANLFYDPRVPVYVRTNVVGAVGPLDFRYYIDLNRNSLFEETGLLSERDNFNNNLGPNQFVGDPQWVGRLEQPEFRHSGDNLFESRYAFKVLPAGKSLDINRIHNQAKNPPLLANASFEGFFRNQGITPSEMNLGAFLVGLNSNAWPLASYAYDTNFVSSGGNAMVDAWRLIVHRNNTNLNTLRALNNRFDLSVSNQFFYDRLDVLGDGPLMTGLGLSPTYPAPLGGGDNENYPWSGSPKIRPYFDLVSELYRPNRAYSAPGTFLARLQTPMNRANNSDGHYDRYTYYRLLSQLGADSPEDRAIAEIHLNFNNLTQGSFDVNANVTGPGGSPLPNSITVPGFVLQNGQLISFTEELLLPGGALSASGSLPGGIDRRTTYRVMNRTVGPGGVTFQVTRDGVNPVTLTPGAAGTYAWVYSLTAPFDADRQSEFIPWEPIQFFGSVANTLLKQLNGLSLDGQAPDIEIYPVNRYNADVHRSLQLAANIYQATRDGTNYPAVFRPTFALRDDDGDGTTNIYISSYVEETNAVFLSNFFIDAKDTNNHPFLRANPDLNVYGVPAVIAAKKGLPNFNEFTLETLAQITRKLEFTKNTNASPVSFTTNQMLIVGITNVLGIEAWNSYISTYSGSNVHLYITNLYSAAVATNQLESNIYVMAPRVNVIAPGTNVSPWFGTQTKLYTGVQGVLTNARFVAGPSPSFTTQYFTNLNSPDSFARPSGFPDPTWFLNITNKFIFAAVEGPTLGTGQADLFNSRVIDYVNLDDLFINIDLSQALLNDTAGAAGLPNMWLTNRFDPNDLRIAPQGVTNQILVSLGYPRVSETLWTYYSPLNGPTSVDLEINKFRAFMNLVPGQGYQQNSYAASTNMSAPFSPTRKYYHIFRWTANDPLVHYTRTDLTDRAPNRDPNYNAYPPPTAAYAQFTRANFYKPVTARITPYSPWGGKRDPVTLLTAYDLGVSNVPPPTINPRDYDLSIKDPLVRRSDDWFFPDGRIGNVGWLGRVHRGTPWQTVYLKGVGAQAADWVQWAGVNITHPTNDWLLANLFTIAPNADARRSRLSVNQTNEAAWAAALGGLLTLSNSVDYIFNPVSTAAEYTNHVIAPLTSQFQSIYNAIVTARNNLTAQNPPGVFTNVGQILGVPELSVGPIIGATRSSEVLPSPFLNIGFPVFPDEWSPEQKYGIHDAAYERIPQQLLSLLTVEDYPRVVIYAYGQSLEPAERSRVLTPGAFYRLCTNYAIKGEVGSRSVVRFEGINPRLGFDSTNDVSLVNNTINIGRVAFRLEHFQRNWGHIANTPVIFDTTPGDGYVDTLPAPLVAGRTYYIVEHGVDYFRVSTQPNGAPVILTTIGDGEFRVTTTPRAVVEKYNLIEPD